MKWVGDKADMSAPPGRLTGRTPATPRAKPGPKPKPLVAEATVDLRDVCARGELVELTRSGKRLAALEKLVLVLARHIEVAKSTAIPPITAQYRAALAEIAELRGKGEVETIAEQVDGPVTMNDIEKRRAARKLGN